MQQCQVTLLRQLSVKRACILNTTYGCRGAVSKEGSLPSMWVSGGCRGKFRCMGEDLRCGAFQVANLTCTCSSDAAIHHSQPLPEQGNKAAPRPRAPPVWNQHNFMQNARADTCAVLNRRGQRRLLFVGDSSMRQLYLAFLLHLLLQHTPQHEMPTTFAPNTRWAPDQTGRRKEILNLTSLSQIIG